MAFPTRKTIPPPHNPYFSLISNLFTNPSISFGSQLHAQQLHTYILMKLKRGLGFLLRFFFRSIQSAMRCFFGFRNNNFHHLPEPLLVSTAPSRSTVTDVVISENRLCSLLYEEGKGDSARNGTDEVSLNDEDPFLRISRMVKTGGYVPICKTEVIDNNLNPKWKPVCLNFQQFRSKETPLLIVCFDFNRSGNHAFIGKMQKSIADFEKQYSERKGANFVLPSKRRRQDKILKGQLFVDQYIEKEQFSFIDYISSGFELNFMVTIDFIASNGNP